MTTFRITARSGARLCRIAMVGVVVAGSTMTAERAKAAPKCIISATAVNFGSYNVFSLPSAPNDNGVGKVSVGCQGGGGPNFPVTLSRGQSGSYATRRMSSGANRMAYNLYTNASRTLVWGDGSSGTGVVVLPNKNSTGTFNIYGRIPGGQDAAVGDYVDSIIATIIF